MSVSAAVASANIPRTYSIGPYKIQTFDINHISGDTTCVVTGDRMDTVLHAILASSVVQTSAPTYSTNSVTFTFTNPAATVYGQCIIIGT